MPVVKAEHASRMMKEAIVLDLGDVAKQAARLKAAAEANAKRIIADAEAEAQRIIQAARSTGFEQGREQGFVKGHEDGLKQGRAESLENSTKEFAAARQQWQQVAINVEAFREQLERDANRAVLELALRMSEKLVHRVVDVDETVIIDQVAAALSHVLRPVDVTVRINELDRAILEESMPELMSDFSQFKHIRLVDDASVAVGGCIVNYGQGRIDARVEEQLDRVIKLMLPDGMFTTDSVGEEPAEEESESETTVLADDIESESHDAVAAEHDEMEYADDDEEWFDDDIHPENQG